MKKNNVSIRTNKFLWLEYIAVSIIVIAFFVISYCGFFTDDDIVMYHGISTLSDVFEQTKSWYFTLGGRLFSVASQYLFSGVLGDNRIWFDIVNTIFFVLLIMVCGRLINDGKKKSVFSVLLFALLFWFLCPVPRQTLFWAAGSITYLWANALTFVFLLFFLKYKDDTFDVVGKMGLFFISIFAATEFITCTSICGAFVVYYAIHIKSFKGNAVPFVIGFAIGSLVLLFAPGNFERAAWEETSFLSHIKDLVHNPILEISKYRALWIFLTILTLGWIKNKVVVKSWIRNNAILLLSYGWSIIAFSVVFRPLNRALFFPETLALVLFLRFLFDNYQIFEIRILDEIMSINRFFVRSVIISVLFVVFMVDSVHAIAETKKQCNNNDRLLNEIKDSGGVIALDRMISSHRMAYVSGFSEGTWRPLADKFGLDSVHIYPFYCQGKFYNQNHPWENVYIDRVNLKDDDDLFGKYLRLIVRIKSEEFQASDNRVAFTIDYTRPHRWYKSWLDKWRNYQYDRTMVVEMDKPDVYFDGYCYYVLWFKQENNLKSVKYTF